jgi:hypothetical protein
MVAKGLALDIGHDIVRAGSARHVLERTRIEKWEDMRMLETGGDLDLPEKALRTECGHELRAQDLDGYQPAVLEVAGQVDRGHPAAAQLPL